MVAHVPLQLRAIGKGVAAVRAAVVILTGLVAILDVFLQRGVAFVAPGAVGASVQLGKRIRCSCGGRERETWMIDDASFFFLTLHMKSMSDSLTAPPPPTPF